MQPKIKKFEIRSEEKKNCYNKGGGLNWEEPKVRTEQQRDKFGI